MKFFERRKARRYPRHQCEKCARHLAPNERVEITDDAPPTVHDGVFGGGGITALYCPDHAPRKVGT